MTKFLLENEGKNTNPWFFKPNLWQTIIRIADGLGEGIASGGVT